MDMSNKVALVTGAASGIGKSVAQLYAQHGAAVVLSDINEALGGQVTEEIRGEDGQAAFVKADVSSPADCERLVNELEFRVQSKLNNLGL